MDVSSHRSGVPLPVGRSVHDPDRQRKWDRNPSSRVAFDPNGDLFYDPDEIPSGPAVSGYDPGAGRKKEGRRRSVTGADLVCVDSDPCGNGESRRSCRCDLCGRCGSRVLDVDLGDLWFLHGICGGSPGASIQRKRSALRRISRRSGLLYPQLCGAREKKEIETLRRCRFVCAVRSDLLGWDQPGHQQFGGIGI